MNMIPLPRDSRSIRLYYVSENHQVEFLNSGGKLIFIAESDSIVPEMRNHPLISSATALLPPCEAVQALFNDDRYAARDIYAAYLATEIPDRYIAIMVTAAMFGNNLIGISFGKDELQTEFPAMFMNILQDNYGIIVAEQGSIILNDALPSMLARLYGYGYIDYMTFMTNHPTNPIDMNIIPKLAYDINPCVPVKDFQHYEEYFNYVKEAMRQAHKPLIDPLVSI